MRTRTRLVAMAIALALAGATVSPGTAQSDPRPELRIRLQFARPGGLYDPGRFNFASDWFVYPSLFNWLARWKPGTAGDQMEPDLATSWAVSPDGLTYTFSLRKGVQFHKGYGEMTADDVVFSFTRQMTDKQMAFNYAVAEIASVEAVDRYTVRMRLKQPNASFLPAVIGYAPGVILSRKAVQELGDTFPKNPVGTGPYVFERLTTGRAVSLVANDAYFRGKPPIRRIVFEDIRDEVVAATALIKGEFQVIWTRGNPEAVTQLRNAPGVRSSFVVRYNSLRMVGVSAKFKPTQDVRVRRALSYAINRQMIAAALPGLELPTDVIRSNKIFGGSLDVPRYPYNPAKARELLREAGYPNGFQVRIMYDDRSPTNVLAEIVRTAWRAIGLTVIMEPTEPTLAYERRDRLDFDTTVESQGRGDVDLFYTDLFLSTAVPPAGGNLFGYAGVDDLILRGRREQDRAARQRIYDALHRKLMTDLPVIPLSNQIFVAAWRDPVVTMINGTNNEFWSETIEVKR